MLRTMNIATNTMTQLQQQLDIIGNNIANSGTHGFKAKESSFHEMLYQQYNNDKGDTEAPRQSPLGIRYGVGAMLGHAQMNWKVGSLQTTERALDFALTEPKQYFNIIMPGEHNGAGEEIVYTRQGAFYVSPIDNGQLMLVNSDGYPVADSRGLPILLPGTTQSYSVGGNGELQATLEDGTIETFELGITFLERPNSMQHISDTYLGMPSNMEELNMTPEDIRTNLEGADRDVIGLKNGMLEMSNVEYQKEMSDLITTQRSYQFNARAATLADQMLGLVNGLR